MSEHDKMLPAFSEDSRPRTRACAGADRIGSDLTALGTSPTDSPSSDLHDRRLGDSAEFVHPATGEIDTLALMTAYDEKCEAYTVLDFKFRQSAKSEVALRKELARQHANDPRSQQIREVLEYWLAACHKPKQTKIPMDGIRAQKVRARLNQDFTVEDLKLAIDGCARMPFVGPRGRVATQEPGCRREDDLELILRDEKNVERFQGYAKQATRQDERPGKEGPVVKRLRRIEEGEAPPIDKALHGITQAGYEWRATASPDIWRAQCPAHDGDGLSLKLTRSPDGMLLLHCNVGCDTEDVLRSIGMEWRDCWEHAERDHQALEYRSPEERATSLPPHLQQAMRQLLARNERQAA